MADTFYEPTEAEIREACRQYQAGWSVQEERRRRAFENPRVGWNPVLACPDERCHVVGIQGHDPEPCSLDD